MRDLSEDRCSMHLQQSVVGKENKMLRGGKRGIFLVICELASEGELFFGEVMREQFPHYLVGFGGIDERESPTFEDERASPAFIALYNETPTETVVVGANEDEWELRA